jgi:antitoxin VapB
MDRTAKLFRNGRSQAVRLPADLRFHGNEVFIRQDEASGDVVLSRRPETWDDFFQLRLSAAVPDDFMSDRQDEPPRERDLFR